MVMKYKFWGVKFALGKLLWLGISSFREVQWWIEKKTSELLTKNQRSYKNSFSNHFWTLLLRSLTVPWQSTFYTKQYHMQTIFQQLLNNFLVKFIFCLRSKSILSAYLGSNFLKVIFEVHVQLFTIFGSINSFTFLNDYLRRNDNAKWPVRFILFVCRLATFSNRNRILTVINFLSLHKEGMQQSFDKLKLP